MPRKNKSFLGRRSGALDVQGEVCLDNPGVVIDRMTILQSALFHFDFVHPSTHSADGLVPQAAIHSRR